VYRTIWTDVQSYSFAPGSPQEVIANTGRVAGWGVDLTVTARLMPALTVTGTFGWNNLKFVEATNDKAVGDPPDLTIPESHSISIDYRPQLSSTVTGIFHADYQHSASG